MEDLAPFTALVVGIQIARVAAEAEVVHVEQVGYIRFLTRDADRSSPLDL